MDRYTIITAVVLFMILVAWYIVLEMGERR